MDNVPHFGACVYNPIMRTICPNPCQIIKETMGKTTQWSKIYETCEKCQDYKQIKV
jgi:hypothetical protein